MKLATTTDWLDALGSLHLLEAAQLDTLSGQKTRLDPQALAKNLVQRGWLSPYQVNQLSQGRGGELLVDRYVLIERLGAGGMGEVFKARDWKTKRVVALKLIRPDRLQSPNALQRFHREIKVVAQLSHPNIVAALDAGEAGQVTYFAMEFVDGTDLSRLVKQKGPLPVGQACEIIRQAALGLQHAHDRGFVHRDIKPQNVLLTTHHSPPTTHQVKILDMGLARMVDFEESISALTQEGSVLGTIDYLSPEQAMNAREVDIRSDLYSLGCTFYFLLTGQVPFPGGTATEKLLKHRLEEPVSLDKLRPEVPATVGTIVRKLLAKRPEDRYQAPRELADAIDHLRQPQLVPKSLLGLRRFPRWIAGLLGLLVIGVVVVAMLSTGGSPASKASAARTKEPRFHPVLKYELKEHPAGAVSFSGHWYQYLPDKSASWDDAQARCKGIGGYLACIQTMEEHQFVVKLVGGKGNNAWLGGYCTDPKSWNWLTGEPFLFYPPVSGTPWNRGQPNSRDNCYLQLRSLGWDDIALQEQGGYASGFVCEWEF
jgi:serine/threonine-protein kinase